MKVIGESEDSFIIEASKNEIANLIGYYSKYDSKFKINAGDQINISDMFKQLYNLEHNKPELSKVVNTLRNLADSLEPVCPVIEKSVIEAVKVKT